MTTGTVINIQRYSLGDGPGVRTTVFLKGCPLRCRWCSNPESQDMRPEVGWRKSLCLHCGRCIETCPEKVISVQGGEIYIRRSGCIRCGLCAQNCPAGALVLYGKEMSVGQVMEEVERDLEYYIQSGGGMTISGGEPLSQGGFAQALLTEAQEEGIHTCIETTGMGDLGAVLPHLDMLYFDIKAMNPQLHKELTGIENQIIQENLALAAKSGVPMVVRLPFVPGYNDGEEELNALGQRMQELGLKELEIMPYHEYGLAKYEALGRDYEVESEKPGPETIQKTRELFERWGVHCSVSER